MTKPKLQVRRTCSHQIAVLENQLALISAEALSATVRHSSLQAHSTILGSWLSILDLLLHLQHSNPPLPLNEQHIQELNAELQQEFNAELQQLLLGSSPLPAPATTRGNACTDPWLETIASPGDPASYFRDLALRPLAPGIETMTALQHLEQHRSLAKLLSLNLHQLDVAGPHPHKIMDTIKQLLDRHYHTLWSLIFCGKLDVADATKLFNLETGTLLSPDSPLLDNQESIKTTLLPALQLSEAQEDQTAYAMEVCESLMAPISAEIAHIQEQLDACVASSSAALRGTAGASEPSSSAAARHAAAEGPEHASAKALLEQQQQLLSRLRIVLRKQYHVAAVSICIFLGGLTWVQAAKMVVYRWPFSASMQYVAKAVWLTQRERVQRQYGSLGSPGGSNMAAAMAGAAGAGKGRSTLAAAELLPQQGCAIEGSSSAKKDQELPALKFGM